VLIEDNTRSLHTVFVIVSFMLEKPEVGVVTLIWYTLIQLVNKAKEYLQLPHLSIKQDDVAQAVIEINPKVSHFHDHCNYPG
jgi:hypothetical protein